MSWENIPKNADETRALVETELDKAAFGELLVANLRSVTKISAQYGLLANILTVVDAGVSGTVSVVDEKFTAQTGVAADGLASILTRRQLSYKPGVGAAARFTTIFDTPVVDSQQAAGLITSENTFAFGYLGVDFGIIYAHGGVDELQELTLTAFAAGVETANVTIDGTVYNIGLTGTGSLAGDAYELAVGLALVVPNYIFTSNGADVIAQAVLPEPMGTFAYASTGASAGAWVQINGGVVATVSFIAQADWNLDTRLEGSTEDILDPELGNVYQIQFQYLGFGAINFYIEDSDSGRFVNVHRIKFANTSATTVVTNPTFRVGWVARNLGNTSNVSVQGASAAAFIEGDAIINAPPRSDFNDQLAIGNVLTNVMSVRNRITFGGKVNRAELTLEFTSLSTQSNRVAFFQVLINPVFAAPVVWGYEDEANSIAEIATDKVTVSGGQPVGVITVVAGSSQLIVFDSETSASILPGDVLCIAAVVPSGAASDCQAALTWKEDI